MDLGFDLCVYLFGNYVECEVEGGFYFCNLYICGGVYDGGIDDNDMLLLLVGDLDGVGMGFECFMVCIIDGNVFDDVDYVFIVDNLMLIGVNCFVFNELFLGGFILCFGGIV